MTLPRTLAFLLASFAVACAQAVDLPDPPNGYSWAYAAKTKSAFLKPDGWHYKKVQQPSGTWGYFISKEDIDKSGEFLTGLTVNIVKDVPAKTGMSAVDYSEAFINEATKSNRTLKKRWRTTMGPFVQFGVRTEVPDPVKERFVTHNLAIANRETGTVYVIVFEAPSRSWASDWVIGEPMLKLFMLDSDV